MCNKYIYLLCGFQSTNSDRFSGDSYEGPPVPISNTVVKLVNAESTWLETAWEDRKLLIKKIKKTPKGVFFIFLFNILFWSGRFQPDWSSSNYGIPNKAWDKQGSWFKGAKRRINHRASLSSWRKILKSERAYKTHSQEQSRKRKM